MASLNPSILSSHMYFHGMSMVLILKYHYFFNNILCLSYGESYLEKLVLKNKRFYMNANLKRIKERVGSDFIIASYFIYFYYKCITLSKAIPIRKLCSIKSFTVNLLFIMIIWLREKRWGGALFLNFLNLNKITKIKCIQPRVHIMLLVLWSYIISFGLKAELNQNTF